MRFFRSIILFHLIIAGTLFSQGTLADLPLISIDDVVFEGGFRVPADPGGSSSMNYAVGPLAYNPANHSIFIIGHTYEQAMIEFPIPALVNSNTTTDLNIAGTRLQPFADVLDRPAGGVPEEINTIGGMAVIDGEILVNAFEYYDAPGSNTLSTLVFRDATNIGSCQVDGYFKFAGAPPAHMSGWISPVPPEWQTALGGDYITGHSSGWPIISRLSVGPSAFVFNSSDIIGNSSVPNPIPTSTLLDFDLSTPLSSDLSNSSGTNDIWTHLSSANYGIIVPGSRTYLTVGFSGGHNSGVCYKCTQSDGNLCGGYCAPDADDYYEYYWLWDMNDLLAVKNGTMEPYEPRPYAYGEFNAPLQPWPVSIGGGTFDTAAGIMYLTLQGADQTQGEYANPPIIVAFSFDVPGTKTDKGLGKKSHALSPCQLTVSNSGLNALTAQFTIMVNNDQQVKTALYDIRGKLVSVLGSQYMVANQPQMVKLSGLAGLNGLYLIRITGEKFNLSRKVVFVQ